MAVVYIVVWWCCCCFVFCLCFCYFVYVFVVFGGGGGGGGGVDGCGTMCVYRTLDMISFSTSYITATPNTLIQLSVNLVTDE